MNRRPQILLSLLVAAGLVTAAWAAISPIRINLTASNPTYQVPSGKVLIIEQAYFDSANASLIVVFSNSTSSMLIEVPSWKGSLTPIQPPLKIGSNDYITALIDTNDNRTSLVMFGLLVNPEDLYAAIPSEFESAARSTGDMSSRLGLASTRQPIIRAETSDDLVDWTQAMNVAVYGTTSPSDYRLLLPLGSRSEFLRARAISRKSSGGIKRD
jgi:hypothetical protein